MIQKYKSELEFENYLRDILSNQIVNSNKDLVLFDNKNLADIIVFRNGDDPKIFFIEVKLYKGTSGRIGFRSSEGKGFQPEILTKRPTYLEKNLKWILLNNETQQLILIDNDTIIKYISGDKIGKKQNNFQTKVFDETNNILEEKLLIDLEEWLND